MSNQAGLGHNNPPESLTEEAAFVLKIEEKHGALATQFARLDRERRKLPATVETQADFDALTAWEVRAIALKGEVERARTAVKKPYLDRGRWIDKWFGVIFDGADSALKPIAQRKVAFLRAEEARKRAQAAAEAAETKRKADEAETARQAAIQKQREAEAEAAAALARLQESARAAAAGAAPVATDAAPSVESNPAPASTMDEAAAKYRAAHEAVQAAGSDIEKAQAEANKTALAASRAEDRAFAGGGRLARASGTSGSSSLKYMPVARIDKMMPFLQSLGPCGQYFTQDELNAMLARMAKHPQRPEVPGISYHSVPEVKTTVARGAKNGDQ